MNVNINQIEKIMYIQIEKKSILMSNMLITLLDLYCTTDVLLLQKPPCTGTGILSGGFFVDLICCHITSTYCKNFI